MLDADIVDLLDYAEGTLSEKPVDDPPTEVLIGCEFSLEPTSDPFLGTDFLFAEAFLIVGFEEYAFPLVCETDEGTELLVDLGTGGLLAATETSSSFLGFFLTK